MDSLLKAAFDRAGFIELPDGSFQVPAALDPTIPARGESAE
ncbi:Uncharacterised protein [Mycobacterium tuberculosis]|nr:Uncharacterised protein [Mycobacterium tuberculosis]